MITIFDLDDTLYDESTYVRSGLAAVARWGQARFGQDADSSLAEMDLLMAQNGRGRVFDDWLRGRASVRDAIKIYRHHDPDIALPDLTEQVLDKLAGGPLYLVTDGHKIVQAKKVEALGIAPRFRHCFLTNRYGAANAKPSLHCFDLIRRREGVDWSDLVYIGDNPAKDFVSLNRQGAHTVRVLTGRHAQDVAAAGHDAGHRIATLQDLPSVLEQL